MNLCMYKWRNLEFPVIGIDYHQQHKLLSRVRQKKFTEQQNRKGAVSNHIGRLLDETV